ncbi:hypothetical protein V6N13_048827 [Hibiscus sabdariffa]
MSKELFLQEHGDPLPYFHHLDASVLPPKICFCKIVEIIRSIFDTEIFPLRVKGRLHSAMMSVEILRPKRHRDVFASPGRIFFIACRDFTLYF